MAVIEAGQPAPDFSLATYEGDAFTREHLLGPDDRPRLLPVRVLAGLHRPAVASTTRCSTTSRERGATLYGVSCDAT